MKRFLLRLLFFCVILFAVSLIFGQVMGLIFGRSQIFKPMLIYTLDKEPTHVILGSSRALTTLNTHTIQKNRSARNEVWFNFSMDDSSPEIHLLLIKMMIEEQKIPKTIFLQYDRTQTPNDITLWQDNDYRFVPLINKSESVNSYFKQKKNYFYVKYIPLSAYAYFNTELLYPSFLAALKPQYRHRFDKFGDVTYPNKKKFTWVGKRANSTIDWEDQTLKEMQKLCADNGIELVLFVAPYIHKTVTNTPADVLNFSALLKNADYYYDKLHVNQRGKDTLTAHFLKTIR